MAVSNHVLETTQKGDCTISLDNLIHCWAVLQGVQDFPGVRLNLSCSSLLLLSLTLPSHATVQSLAPSFSLPYIGGAALRVSSPGRTSRLASVFPFTEQVIQPLILLMALCWTCFSLLGLCIRPCWTSWGFYQPVPCFSTVRATVPKLSTGMKSQKEVTLIVSLSQNIALWDDCSKLYATKVGRMR